jgi:starch phosphorylase
VTTARVAYFSMEIALDPSMPTYAGGLGVLAGDTLRSAADLAIPMVAVTLLHRRGYFDQRLDARGEQSEAPVTWPVQRLLEPLEPRVEVEIEGRIVGIRARRYQVIGVSGSRVPVYFLDTDLPENTPGDRALTDVLYGGDATYRLRQEAVLGLGGVRMLRALGHDRLVRFHLNEGHAALLVLALLEERLAAGGGGPVPGPDAIDAVRQQCVFTTHTPVPAGHDQFPAELARHVLGTRRWAWVQACGQQAVLNMTDLALCSSQFINGVAMRHGEVSRGLFPGYPIRAITNGVHAATWAAPSFQALYDRHLPDWRHDALSLRYAIGIPGAEVWDAHQEAKRALLEHVNRHTDTRLDEHVLTIGFARRATAYKRATLLFHDLERLKALAAYSGPLQVVFAGKAHPRDDEGKEMIRRVHEAREALRGRLAVTYLANYDMALARLVCAGVDAWLNTPLPPLEASGTSGMKAAINGVPSLSVLDGWWIEGHIEGVTGWAIGEPLRPASEAPPRAADLDAHHAAALCDKLATSVLPCFYAERDRFIDIMRHAIALNGSFFNSQRMVWQYLHNAYQV